MDQARTKLRRFFNVEIMKRGRGMRKIGGEGVKGGEWMKGRVDYEASFDSRSSM